MCGFSWFSFLFPTINDAINNLSRLVRKNGPCKDTHFINYMSYTTSEAVAAIDAASTVIIDLKASLTAALASLAPLAAENDSLKAAQDILVAADADVDAAIARLVAVTKDEEVVVEPVVEEVTPE